MTGSTETHPYDILIVGGGTAGITVAAQLAPKLRGKRVGIIEPASMHYYQPQWTLVGGGIVSKEETGKPEAELIPKGVQWIRGAVERFEPDDNRVVLADGTGCHYRYLVVCPGIKILWDGIDGLTEALKTPYVCSNYSAETVEKTWQCLQRFKGGTAIFTHPSTPIKCGGAPQKIMYLADDTFRKNKVREGSQVLFACANGAVFAVPRYAEALNKVIARKNIDTLYRHDLVAIDAPAQQATFKHMDTGETQILHYDMMHVTPPMGPPDCVKHSPLANEGGWVDVDSSTLQHMRYPNVFGLGDASSLPTSKTGAAIRKQAPVVVANLISVMKDEPASKTYNGYTSCPLVTGYGKLILAEFGYDGEIMETFPFNQAKERLSMYILKKDILPQFYWNLMLKGLG